eukprot:902216-Amorphochlora_amoeboformis.AAC.1
MASPAMGVDGHLEYESPALYRGFRCGSRGPNLTDLYTQTVSETLHFFGRGLPCYRCVCGHQRIRHGLLTVSRSRYTRWKINSLNDKKNMCHSA